VNPTDFPQANHTFGKPSTMTDEECGALRVHTAIVGGLPCSISRWEPSVEERRALAAGGAVWLYVYGMGHPVVALTAEPPWPEAAAPALASAGDPSQVELRAGSSIEPGEAVGLCGRCGAALGFDAPDGGLRPCTACGWRPDVDPPAVAAASCPTCGTCSGGATCTCNDVRCPCWHARHTPPPSPGHCSLDGAPRIRESDGTFGACSLVAGADGKGGCRDPMHDVRRDKAASALTAERIKAEGSTPEASAAVRPEGSGRFA
jgi:hypothetical protein